MKVWKFYLKIKRSRYTGKLLLLITNSMDYHYKGDNLIGLYAWTTDKKFARSFKETRNMNNFIVRKDYIDEEDYHILKDKKHNQQLKNKDFVFYKESGEKSHSSVICTTDEYVASTKRYNGLENIVGTPLIIMDTKVPCELMHKKIYKALSKIGFVDCCISQFNYGYDIEQLYNYNASFNRNFDGGIRLIEESFKEKFDELNALAILFEDAL